MTFSALYVLPALAILILIQGSWISSRGKNMHRSRKHQRRARHRVLFFRALIVALILATALTKAWPLPPLLEIVQGVMITIAIMTPICVYIVISKLWPQQPYDKRDSEATHSGPADAPDLRPAHAPAHLLAEETNTLREHEEHQQPEKQTAEQLKESLDESLDELLKGPLKEPLKVSPEVAVEEPLKASPEVPVEDPLKASPEVPVEESLKVSRKEPLELSLEDPLDISLEGPLTESPEDPLADSLDDSPTDTEQPASQSTEKNAATSLHSQSPQQESALDQTLSVGEQMETLDDLVDFHDIGDDDNSARAAGPYNPDAAPVHNPLEQAIAVARDAILDEPGIQDYSTENLPAKSRIELSEMVVRLRNDKMKLQKLVIAQKAVIDSEKQAHERTRVVVKDAISVMRHARHGQRIAEKIARRERAERQRLEKDYVKVRRALDNAMSTLKNKSERSNVEKA